MKDNNFQQMADILPSPPIQTVSWFWLLALILLAVFGLFVWRYFRNPYYKLNRQLRQGSIDPRQVAHTLARLARPKQRLHQELDNLRFQRKTPDKQTLLALIKKIQYDQ